MPDLKDGRYIADLWIECGMSLNSTGGIYPLTWQEISSFSSLQSGLNEFESQCIFAMSKSYVQEFYHGKNKDAQAPYMTEETKRKIEENKKKLNDIIK